MTTLNPITRTWPDHFQSFLECAGPDGLRRAGFSNHEQLRMSQMTTEEQMRFVGPERIADVAEAAMGHELSEGLRWKLRQSFGLYLAQAAFDDLTAPPDPDAPVDGVWP